MSKLIVGIDEAGRGPVIGPLVIAGAAIEEKDRIKLQELGVKDSKLLTPKQREYLYDKILAIVKNKIIIIPPNEIDAAVESETLNLNWLEAIKSVEIIAALKPDKAILDCPSNNIKAYTNYIKNLLSDKGKQIEIICEHKADVNHIEVAAASILAKVTRDRLIEDIKKKIKIDFGSGYPSDPKTVDFLKNNWNKYDFFRKSWSSWKKHAEEKKQKTLVHFIML